MKALKDHRGHLHLLYCENMHIFNEHKMILLSPQLKIKLSNLSIMNEGTLPKNFFYFMQKSTKSKTYNIH